MAQTFQEGFNGGANGAILTTANTNFTSVVNAPVFATDVKKTGTASVRYTTSSAYSFVTRSFTPTTKRYWSLYMRPVAAPSVNTVLFFVGNSNADADRIFQLTLTSTLSVKVQQGSSAIILGSAAVDSLPLNQWSRLDVSYEAGVITCALFPGDGNCDNATGTATAGDTIGGTVASSTVSYLYLGVGNASTVDFYIDDFLEDDAAVPVQGSVSGTITPYLYYDNGATWTDVTQSLWYDNGTNWVQVENGT